MRFVKSLGTIVSILALVSAHPTEHADTIDLNTDFSLVDLVKGKEIPSTWTLGDSSVLEEGRIRLTPDQKSKGSLWGKNTYQLKDSFSLEWTFRSVNYDGVSKGGLSFWFLSSSDSKLPLEKSFYNGPSKFDGLQLLVDNNGPLGPTLRAQFNDGVQTFTDDNVYDNTFASCLLGYQDSSVPLTVRLTYDRNYNNFLKVQIDNRVCFQTRKAKLPAGNYFVGATADNSDTDESFEILKVQMYDAATEVSLIPNVNPQPQPKVLTKIIDEATGETSLLEKDVYDAQHDKVSNFEIYKKLDKVEGKILANDIHSLKVQLEEISKSQAETIKLVAQLSQALQNVGTQSAPTKDEDNKDYKNFFAVNEKLEKMLEEAKKLRESSSHSGYAGPHVDEIAKKLAIWIVPLIIIMLIMAYYTFRIRQEIVKTKLL
ncbi:hypothetical protein HG535_0D06150 [Zygotorulaspora mrakii]|uniref:L-type lectin-like domain-containing protein n=1 Tax=Zygotorulaspora mrakii TaxID=42260 RepID=A0A7H9B397_ZYGMR|nr:uncharacterized protein HG535_0D06150 [Zygotorulaspora mrakii]QLG72906.1 hypothetical protein HG535_0D06150 [Zygotorulaspora mrakii]